MIRLTKPSGVAVDAMATGRRHGYDNRFGGQVADGVGDGVFIGVGVGVAVDVGGRLRLRLILSQSDRPSQVRRAVVVGAVVVAVAVVVPGNSAQHAQQEQADGSQRCQDEIQRTGLAVVPVLVFLGAGRDLTLTRFRSTCR